MSILDELKKMTRPYDDDDGMMDDDMEMDEEPSYSRPSAAQQPQPQPQPAAAPVDNGPINMGGVGSMGAMGSMGSMGAGQSASGGINLGFGRETAKYRVVLIPPESVNMGRATVIANHFREGCAVILNCEDTDKESAKRVIDFLSGCAYALDGKVMKAANSVYILVPKDVGVDEDKTEDDEA